MDFVIAAVVLGGCVFAFFAIGDLFDRFFGTDDPERVHRRRRPRSRHDRPATTGTDRYEDKHGSERWQRRDPGDEDRR